MAKNVTLLGANYPGVPAVTLPQTGGGTATFVDADEVGSVESALAIVVNGDTAPQAITSGQYLFIKNHSTLATGGYHATSNISSGGTVSSSNVSADPDGIANTIHEHIANLENHSATELLSTSSGTFDEKTLSQSMFNFPMLEFVILSSSNAVVGSPMHITPSVLSLHNSNTNLANLRCYDGSAWTTVRVRYNSQTKVNLDISNTNETLKIYGIK